MSLISQLVELDKRLFAELDKGEELDQDFFDQQLAARGQLLQQVINEGHVTAEESSDLINRSRQLTTAAEQLQQQLGEQLKKMNKGRRSVQAYQIVKKN